AAATGDLSRRSPVTTRDELGKMATAFNRMLDQLQATRGELEVVNRDLEARVEERTRRWEEEQEQRLRAEEEILHLERFYRNVLDAVPLEVAVFDSEGRYVFLNPSAGQDYETPDGMVGRRPALEDFRRPVNADVLNRRAQAIRQVLDTACLVTLEERLESRDPGAPDGFRAFIRVFTPMLVSEGKVTRVVAYGVDITSLREAEEALRVSEEKLRQSQKMEAVGRLAGGIAHDFNNLLTVIVGHTELLLADKAGGDPDVEELNQMKSAADRATTLTRQLLAFSRRQVLQPRLLQMNRVVSDLESLLVRLLGEQVSLLTILRPDAGQVRADPGQLEQILMNLVANARDAMPEGGTLTIETNRITSAQAAGRWGDPVEPGQYVMLSVRDTGIGIPEENLPRIFEPFFTTKDVGRGTGLGLATVYGIVEQSAGFIFVSSSVGLGTVFRIYLPEAISAAAVSGPSEASGDRRETILIVEDEPLVRDLSARVLERSGYQVLLATGGHEALGILRNLSAPIDLLVTDLVMPGIMGHELAARVREALPDLPVLYMSGFADGALMDRLAGDDGVVMLQKPFTPERLLQAVRRTLARNPTRSTL
ncbi:MAG: response regulator, partial [Gemmatimonadetes bacterium]|nr:response regulator [Gemmatimonadota bacterium]